MGKKDKKKIATSIKTPKAPKISKAAKATKAAKTAKASKAAKPGKSPVAEKKASQKAKKPVTAAGGKGKGIEKKVAAPKGTAKAVAKGLTKVGAQPIDRKADKKADKRPEKPVKKAVARPAAEAPLAPSKGVKPAAPSRRSAAKRPTPEVEDEELKAADSTSEGLAEEEVVLTDAEGRRYCRVPDCDQLAQVEAYCRYHYLLFWKKIQNRKKILSGGKLQKYIEDLAARYSDKYLEILRKDLRSEKDFLTVIQELELDDSSSSSSEDEDDKSYIEEIRGVAAPESAGADEDF